MYYYTTPIENDRQLTKPVRKEYEVFVCACEGERVRERGCERERERVCVCVERERMILSKIVRVCVCWYECESVRV